MDFFCVKTFTSVKARYLFCQRGVSLVETRRMVYNLTLKRLFENLPSCQGHDLIWKGHVAYLSIRIVGLNTSMVFALLYQKYLMQHRQLNAYDAITDIR